MTLDHTQIALIVIDMQRDFCSPGGYAHRSGIDIERMQAVVGTVGQLLQAARAAGVLVVHTREGHLPDLSDCPPAKLRRSAVAGAPIGGIGPMGRLLIRGEYGHDFVDELQPGPGEIVIDKPGYGAFHATMLGDVLAARGVQQLIRLRRHHRGLRAFHPSRSSGPGLPMHHRQRRHRSQPARKPGTGAGHDRCRGRDFWSRCQHRRMCGDAGAHRPGSLTP